MAMYFQTTMPDPTQHATPHSFSTTAMSKVLSLLSMSPDLNPNDHTENELERRVQDRLNALANVRELS